MFQRPCCMSQQRHSAVRLHPECCGLCLHHDPAPPAPQRHWVTTKLWTRSDARPTFVVHCSTLVPVAPQSAERWARLMPRLPNKYKADSVSCGGRGEFHETRVGLMGTPVSPGSILQETAGASASLGRERTDLHVLDLQLPYESRSEARDYSSCCRRLPAAEAAH